jgi:hypothetical protein
MKSQLEKLNEKLKEQCEAECKLVEIFQQEVKAQTNLADLYKGII